MDNDNLRDEYGLESGDDPREWLQRLTGRYLGDVRIHDSSQAGTLAKRLGARAFTVGRDIYVRPELMRPRNRRSAALLAHELTHVVEQTGGTPAGEGGPEMPLFVPRAEAAPSRGGQAMGSGSPVPVQRVTAPSASEQRAEATEAAVMNRPTKAKKAQPEVDPEELADRVYKLMMREMITDRERGL